MNKMKNISIICLCLLLSGTVSVNAQDNTEVENIQIKHSIKKPQLPSYPTMEIKGLVVDAVGKKPLAGIQVKALNNDNYAAMTEDDGTFAIKVPTFTTSLYVSSPEYIAQQVAIQKNGVIKIQMLSDKFGTMYNNGTEITAQRKMIRTKSTSLTAETDIEDKLGADVRSITRSGTPGYGAAMFIRGINSLNANTQPLIVLDGVLQDMQDSRYSLHTGEYNNLFQNINPDDIDNITVLKNATALYGARGGNGVILINTKRGHSMATRIEANVSTGISLQPKLVDVMNASQYRLYATEMIGTIPKINTYTGTFNFLNDDVNGYYYKMYHNDTDWSKEVYHEALTQNYSINVQGGDDIGMYNLSLGYTDGQSTAKQNGFNRLNIRFNTDISITSKLTTLFDMSYVKVNRNVFDDGAPTSFEESTVTSPTFLALIKAPILNPYTFNSTTGKLSSTLSGPDDFVSMLGEDLSLGNPTAILVNGEGVNKNRTENTEFNTRIVPKYEFNPHLSLTESFSYTLNRNSQRYYRPVNGVPVFKIEGLGSVKSMTMSMFSKEISIMSDTKLDFKKQFGKHYLNAFGGFRYVTYSFDNSQIKGQYQSAGNDKTPNPSNDMDYKQPYGNDDQWRNMTWYGNADYNYLNKYFIQATLAAESSSRFGSECDGIKLAGVRWGIFPSLQAGWVMTNEKWFPKNIGINYLRVNAGYDISGNDDISNYAARTSFSAVTYLFKNTGIELNNIGNENIQWEQTNKLNFGLQSYFLNNRLGVNLDVFFNRTNNLLTLKSFDSPVSGINNYWSNGGSLANRGFEATVTTKPINSKNWKMEVGASVGHYVNEIKSLPNNNLLYVNGEQTAQGYTTSLYGTDNIATIVGQSVGVFYGYKTAGVFSTDAEAKAAGKNGYLYMVSSTGEKQYYKAGDVHFVDLHADGKIDEADKTVIGNPNPDIYGNIFAVLNYKNFTLNLGFNYSLGNDVYNYQRSILESESNFFNQTTAVTNRWRYEGQITDVPRLSYKDVLGNSRFSDRWIEDGSYLRLKTVKLTYNVPVNLSWLQGLSIWAEANNLFTITHYLGSDPEFSISNGALYQGIDAGNVALSRSFTLGLKINL